MASDSLYVLTGPMMLQLEARNRSLEVQRDSWKGAWEAAATQRDDLADQLQRVWDLLNEAEDVYEPSLLEEASPFVGVLGLGLALGVWAGR